MKWRNGVDAQFPRLTIKPLFACAKRVAGLDAAFAELVRRPHFERSQQIFLQARRRFVGDFDARLKENRRKLRMRFGRQPETKIFVRFQRVQFLRREKNDREETREKTTFSKVVNHDVTR